MEKRCKDLVRGAYESRMEDIRAIMSGKSDGEELPKNISEYGLSIDFVPAHTFEGQQEGYTRYQLSWGGPSEEFRVFTIVPRVEFWFLDWFDGAKVIVPLKDANIIRAIVGKAAI